MPKNFGDGAPRLSAKEREAEKKKAEKAREERAKEDASWKDDDKDARARMKRAEEKHKKAEETAARRAENKALAAQEEASVSQAKKTPAAKVTQEAEKERLAKLAKEQEKLKPGAVVRQDPIEENPNRAMAAMLEEEGAYEARSVEDAISLLSVKSADDAFRRRVKSAYIEFREETLPVLQQQNPSLRRSQLLDSVYKEWQRSPKNPVNQ